MGLKSKSIVALSSAVCMVAVLATGCNTVKRIPQSPNRAGTTQLSQNMLTTNPRLSNLNAPGRTTVTLPGTTVIPDGMRLNQQITTTKTFDTQKADRIKRDLKKMSEIKDTKVVVNGNTALVGYTLSNAVKDVSKIKTTITNKVKQIDNSITKVIATDSAKVVTDIDKLEKDIRGNKPLNALNDTFKTLTHTILPKPAA